MNVDALLDELNAERLKFSEADKAKIEAMVNTLVEMGVYPVQAKSGHTALDMVEWYGARWHVYREPIHCPNCNADLRDYKSGPPGKREILIKPDDYLVCPDCREKIGNLHFGRFFSKKKTE